jgi:probable phosphoglycerate mutase
VRQLRAAGGSIEWAWIPRAQNKAADKLSNDGMDGKTVEHDLWRADGAERPSAIPPRAPLAVVTRLILLRHGVTDLTVTGRLDGRGGVDPELNDQGRAQAEKAAVALAELVTGPVHVVTSSLARARQTGDAVARSLGVAATVDDGWDEQSFGVWDGMSYPDISERFPGDPARMRAEEDFRAEGGESHLELAARVDLARERALALGGTVVVATHRMPILCVLQSLLGLSLGHAWLLAADPASFTGINVYADGNATVAYTNDTHHLR